MPKTTLWQIDGQEDGQIELPKEIFAAKINPPLMAQAVRVYLSNQRKAHPKVKTRGEVKRTKAKWFRQKGTGRARHGARSAPIFVGGGVAHGPKGVENYHLKLSKKMKKAALFSALSSKLKAKEIIVVQGLGKIKPRTKEMVVVLKNLKAEKKALLILPKVLENVIRSGRNLKEVKLVQADSLNTYRILNSQQLIFMEESLEVIKKTFLKKN